MLSLMLPNMGDSTNGGVSRSQELGMHLPNPLLTFYVDNMQAVAFSRDTALNSKLRGIFDLRADWVAELKDKLELRVEHVDSVNNPADLVTT